MFFENNVYKVDTIEGFCGYLDDKNRNLAKEVVKDYRFVDELKVLVNEKFRFNLGMLIEIHTGEI